MKRPDKPVEKKVSLAEMKKAIDDRYELLRDLMEKNELDSYMTDDKNINGDMVEQSYDITPEQVATLGAYSEIQMLHNLYHAEPNTKKEVDVKGIVVKDGEVKHLKMEDLPKEVQDYFKGLIKGEEDE